MDDTRVCTKCNQRQVNDEFYLTCYGRNEACKACVKKKNRDYYLRKKNEISEKHAARRAIGVPADVGMAERRQARPFEERYAERREKLNARKRERHLSEPGFKDRKAEERQFSRALSGWGQPLAQIVQCPLERFNAWIEYQFAPGMTWDNYGKVWGIDHADPRDNFDTTIPEQRAQCHHWSNLRPLTPRDNSIKCAKRDEALIESQQMDAYIFELLQ